MPDGTDAASTGAGHQADGHDHKRDRHGRNAPHSHAEATAAFGIGFFQKLSAWLIARRPESTRGRILDFGCADLRLALPLDGTWIVDGFDEWAQARDAARAMLGRLETPGVVYDAVAGIPLASYDAIVLNSVFQYVEDGADAQRLFESVGPLLAHDAPIGIVVTDAVSDGASRLRDLRDVMRYAFGSQGLVMGAVFTIRAVRSGRPSKRYRISQADLEAAAAAAGLVLTRHPENLTTFTRRSTFLLKHRASS